MDGKIFVVAAILGWGIWGVFQKLAQSNMNPLQVAITASLVHMSAIPIYFWLMKTTGFHWVWNRGILWGVLAGIFTSIATLSFTYALKTFDASYLAAITAVYPAVTFIIAIFVFNETITLAKCLGLLLILLGTIFLSH